MVGIYKPDKQDRKFRIVFGEFDSMRFAKAWLSEFKTMYNQNAFEYIRIEEIP